MLITANVLFPTGDLGCYETYQVGSDVDDDGMTEPVVSAAGSCLNCSRIIDENSLGDGWTSLVQKSLDAEWFRITNRGG